jgi:hypothetical protein
MLRLDERLVQLGEQLLQPERLVHALLDRELATRLYHRRRRRRRVIPGSLFKLLFYQLQRLMTLLKKSKFNINHCLKLLNHI